MRICKIKKKVVEIIAVLKFQPVVTRCGTQVLLGHSNPKWLPSHNWLFKLTSIARAAYVSNDVIYACTVRLPSQPIRNFTNFKTWSDRFQMRRRLS